MFPYAPLARGRNLSSSKLHTPTQHSKNSPKIQLQAQTVKPHPLHLSDLPKNAKRIISARREARTLNLGL